MKAIDHTSSALEGAKQNVRPTPKQKLPQSMPCSMLSMTVRVLCSIYMLSFTRLCHRRVIYYTCSKLPKNFRCRDRYVFPI